MSELLCLGDIEICARTVYGEARGEAFAGKVAVARVMVNRWKSKLPAWSKDDTLASACLRHLQFSGWTESDPNYTAQYGAAFSDRGFLECWRAVLEALLMREGDDPTKNALHYHADYVTPNWVLPGHSPCVIIGRHKFYNSIP